MITELVKESLYQYDTVTTVRGTFHADLDEYDNNDEENYSKTSLPSTLDMENLAHRTLWCETR